MGILNGIEDRGEKTFLKSKHSVPGAGVLLTLPVYGPLGVRDVACPMTEKHFQFLHFGETPSLPTDFRKIGAATDPQVIEWLERFLTDFAPSGSTPPWSSIREILELKGHLIPDNQGQALVVQLLVPKAWAEERSLAFLCESMSFGATRLPGTTFKVRFSLIENFL